MKRITSENLRWYGMVLGLVAVLIMLAILQYRSVKAVSQVTTAQMRASLQGSLMDVRQGVERELAPLTRELQFGMGSPKPIGTQEIAGRMERWRRSASHPDLVEDVYIWQPTDQGAAPLVRLNPAHNAFETATWPEKLTELHRHLVDSNPGFGGGGGGPDGNDSNQAPPGNTAAQHPPLHADNSPTIRGDGRPAFTDHSPDSRNARLEVHGPPPESAPTFPLLVDEAILAIVHPYVESAVPSPLEGKPHGVNCVIVVLSRTVLAQQVFPEIIQRYFGSTGSSYEIAIVNRDPDLPSLYSSDAGFGTQADLLPDAALNLFGRPLPVIAGHEIPIRGMIAMVPPAGRPGVVSRSVSPPSQGFRDDDLARVDPMRYHEGQAWQIIAKHREGSVDAAVAALSRRNLIFNFGVLLVLAATMATIIVASQRARRLGQLQMDFVANISHELRTPLTGIMSAAQNMADGVVEDKERVPRYGRAIVGQAQQLMELIEQILLFSATSKGRYPFRIEAVDVAQVIDASLKNVSAQTQSSGVIVERSVPAGLPPVSADIKALSHSLQNLIANAVKYGGDAHWVRVAASLDGESNGKREVTISVADRGIGISPEDLARIFEPFYRSPDVTAAQIHGSGLGLPLAKSAAESMGGRLTVRSEVGKGSTFTLHLPVA